MDVPNLELIHERFLNALGGYEKYKEEFNAYPDFDLYMFSQVWGSTALGFDSIGGQAITGAYTTVVCDAHSGWHGVFFSEQLAYKIKNPNQDFFDDMIARSMEGCNKRGKYKRVEH